MPSSRVMASPLQPFYHLGPALCGFASFASRCTRNTSTETTGFRQAERIRARRTFCPCDICLNYLGCSDLQTLPFVFFLSCRIVLWPSYVARMAACFAAWYRQSLCGGNRLLETIQMREYCLHASHVPILYPRLSDFMFTSTVPEIHIPGTAATCPMLRRSTRR